LAEAALTVWKLVVMMAAARMIIPLKTKIAGARVVLEAKFLSQRWRNK
jgi:hypothetical protein